MSRETLASPVSNRGWLGILVLFLAVLSSAPIAEGQAAWTTIGTNTYCVTCNVGIATTTPTQRLQLTAGNIQIPTANGAFDGNLFIGGNAVNQQSGMRLFGGVVNGSIDAGFIDVRTAVPTNGLFFRVDTVTGGTERMRITAEGKVGIGTTAPLTTLHVAGSLTVDGNIAAKYQDVAEWVPAAERMPAGTVVVLDRSKANRVTSSGEAYDTKVAGVVSEKPGLTLGESGAGKALIATTGRVRVRVDASRCPIRIGDLLVTSDRSGMAMKSEPLTLAGVEMHRPGTLIGKALENLAEGEGEILVLLSLH